jgi:hypothetical protein
MAALPLTLAQLSKAQAEAEGFQGGPQPALNPANLYTQDCLAGNPQTPGTPASATPYYPSSETPSLRLSIEGLSSQLANNFVILDQAVPAVDAEDLTGLITGALFSYQPLISGLFNIVIVATAIAPQGIYPPAQVSVSVSYTDNAGPEFNDEVVVISDTLQPSSVNEAVFALSTAPITVNSSYVTFGIAGAKPANAWQAPVTLGGSGTAAYGATIYQATSGATAFYYGSGISLGGVPGFMLYTVLTGVDDGVHTWTDVVSGQTFAPTSAPVAGTFTGPGFGVNMIQFVTGSFGPEMDAVPTTVMHLGPQISGVPNLPSGRVIIAGAEPSLTHNYAWYDPVNGGVFVPTVPWTDVATRMVFPYNLHVRILQIA